AGLTSVVELGDSSSSDSDRPDSERLAASIHAPANQHRAISPVSIPTSNDSVSSDVTCSVRALISSGPQVSSPGCGVIPIRSVAPGS
ncbi:hypothetical protein PCANC_28153, partial [Puccinia coronata f. sp. avenae]